MMVESQNQQPSVNVYPNGNGGGYGGGFGDMFGAGSGGILLWLIIFFFMMMMGWGNNNGNASGNGGGASVAYIPYMGMMGGMGGCCGGGNQAVEAVRQGFDQSAVIGGINGLETQLQTGFSNAEVSRCNQQANILATMNANQNSMNAAMNAQAMALQNCCCENRQAVAQLGYNIATEACADRQAVNDALQAVTMQNNANTNMLLNAFNGGVQSLKDQMCNDKIDAKNERIADLERQLTMANLAASQTAQTAQILANNEAQTSALERYLAPNPIPAYIVQNPSCCNQNLNPCSCNTCCGR